MGVEGVIVRPAAESDTEACAGLLTSEAAEIEAWRRRYCLDVRSADRMLVVAEAALDRSIVGFGRVVPHDPGKQPAADAAPAGFYLLGVQVRSDWRRKGVGLELTRIRMEWVRQRANGVYFFTRADNLASAAMHQQLGFVQCAEAFSFPTLSVGHGQVLYRARFHPDGSNGASDRRSARNR